jgi:hypothetical protein
VVILVYRSKASTDDKLESLVNSLQTSFDLEGKEVKKDIAETLVPTVNRVKALYRVLDDKVDTDFGKGLLAFNKACKDTEAMAINEQDELKQAYIASQVRSSWVLGLAVDSLADED